MLVFGVTDGTTMVGVTAGGVVNGDGLAEPGAVVETKTGNWIRK